MCLQKLFFSNHEVLAVVTIPDKARGRGQKMSAAAVKQFAIAHNLEALQPAKLKDETFVEKLKKYEADAFVVVAFRILPEKVFSIPPQGTINVHASLLPKYRGAAPINWALISGDTLSGVTTMRIDAKVDTGNILLQDEQLITADMDAGQLHDLLAEKGANLLIKTLDKLESEGIKPAVQDESQVTKAPKITREIAGIDFSQPAGKIYNLIRGLSPYPAAFCFHHKKQIKVFKSKTAQPEKSNATPGTLCKVGPDYFDVVCGKGAIRIFEVQIEGKKCMSVRNFLNGYTMREGDVLT